MCGSGSLLARRALLETNPNEWMEMRKTTKAKECPIRGVSRDFIATLLGAWACRVHLPPRSRIPIPISAIVMGGLVDHRRPTTEVIGSSLAPQQTTTTTPEVCPRLSSVSSFACSPIPAQAQSPRRRSPRFELYVLLFIIIYLYIYLCSTHIV